MKTRNGFVSNSSSSSFVVAFPKEPKSFEDVFQMMFNSKEGRIQFYDFIDGMSYTQIATRVWGDLQKKYDKNNILENNVVPAKLKDIVEVFGSRYYYTTSDQHVSWSGRKNDELGGSWGKDIGPFFGSDLKALYKLRDFTIKTNQEEKDIENQQKNIIKNEFKINRAPYACKGSKNSRGEIYTKKEIKDYDNYCNAMNKFRIDNKQYNELQQKLRKISQYDIKDKLTNKIAKADAKAFQQINKDAFIVILEYSDGCQDSTLEHGDIFKNLPHVVISNH